MVLTEVLQNAVQHGYDGGRRAERSSCHPRRLVGRLHVTVDDDGRGLPDGFDLDAATNLGLSIVRTLVESELGGQLTLGPAPAGLGDAGGGRRTAGVTVERRRRPDAGPGRCAASGRGARPR